MDSKGRWIGRYVGHPERGRRVGLTGQPKFPSPDFQYLASAVFSRSLETLSEYLIETRNETAAAAADVSAE